MSKIVTIPASFRQIHMLEKFKNRSKNNSVRHLYFNSIYDVPMKDWLAVQQKKVLFLEYTYLHALETTLSPNISFRYILFYRETIPIGIAVTQLIKVDPDALNLSEFPCKINESIKNIFLKNMDVKVLICGNLFSCGEYGFIFNEDVDKTTTVKLLSDALLALRKKEDVNKPSFILLKEFWPQSNYQVTPLQNQKFRELNIDYNMVLSILPHWKTFDDYMDSMKTKFRTRAKKVFKNSDKIVPQYFNERDISFYASEINTLYHSVLDNADFKIGKLNATTFKRLKETLGDSFIFKGYFLEKKLVGFMTAFATTNAVEANHIGINYDLNKTYDIYQRMLYDYVAIAIDLQVVELHLGRTAETIKSGVGAKPIPMKLYVRHSNSFSNKLLKPIMEMITPSEFEIRNPFKKLAI